MKAIKGCVNRDCKSYVKKEKFKDTYDYCPFCREKLEYVCAVCWKTLDHSTTRLCDSCKAKRDQKRAEQLDKVKDAGTAVINFAEVAWEHKDKIGNAAKKAVKVIKK